MASYINVVLDTTAPAAPAISLNGGAAVTTSRDITASISTSDSPATGYEILIWGDVDPAANADIQTLEANSTWIVPGAWPANQAVRLSSGDGVKEIFFKIRDDTWNATVAGSDTIELDTTAPTPNIVSGPDTTKVSTVAGKRVVNFGFQVSEEFEEYEIAVVASGTSLRGSGTVIGTANGSVNTAGNDGPYPANTTINVSIDGRDLKAASDPDGTKVIKIFVRDANNNWSQA